MPAFTSKRERRLWLAALAVVLAIYATLGLTRSVADILREHDLLSTVFGTGLLLILLAILLQGIRARLAGLEIGVALGIVGAYTITGLRLVHPEERTHLIEYSVVALLVHEALAERRGHGWLTATLTIVITGGAGVLDECIQIVLPSRVFDPLDMAFNALAAVMAVVGSAALAWARRRTRREH